MNEKMYVYKDKLSSFFEPITDVAEFNKIKRKKCLPLTTKEFVEKAVKIHGNKYDYSKVVYLKNFVNVLIRCNEHDIEFWQTPTNHLSGWFGCPHCGSSNVTRGERLIKEFLEENHIKYVYQKRFNDCKNKKTLRFDFWLPEIKTIIEYDGKQHYFPVDFFGGKISFEQIQLTDRIKGEYARKNNYKLLRISYIEIKNLSIILKNNIINN